MPVIALGLNHTTASIDIREQLNFPPERLPEALQDLVKCTHVEEAVILSTCNRTELYCNPAQNAESLVSWLGAYHHIPPDALQPYLYTHSANSAVRHLLRVACGLDSMVLGEPQILGQLKTAYNTALQNKTLGTLLGKLFQHSFATAKQVRTDTAIGSSPVSVAFAAVRLARQIFGDLGKQTALLIGAGETIELAARHLHENKLRGMVVANRTLERARHLATEMGGYAITLPEIPQHLAEADIIISSTGASEPVLTRAMVEKAIRTRKHRPMFIVDIAVPRDIEPQVGELDDVYLYSVDDLNEVIEENLRSRKEAAHQAEEIIDTQVSHFMGWLQSRNAVGTIRDLRNQAEAKSRDVLEKARRRLRNGGEPEEVLQFLAHTLTNNLLHTPTSALRQAGTDNNRELISVARELYQLPDE